MIVDVYRNLQKDCWSIKHRGLVISHRNEVIIGDARFVVQPAGNAKVRANGVKNVHAFVRGTLLDEMPKVDAPGELVGYNPYQDTSFVLPYKEGEPIHNASTVFMLIDEYGGLVIAYP